MIVIIGGSSFVGLYTAKEFIQRNYKVVVTGREGKFREYYTSLGVEYIDLDLTNKDDFGKLPTQDVECVILLAALLPANSLVNLDEDENAWDYFLINTGGTINVLEYCRVNNIKRMISTTTYADVFNSWEKDYLITENEPRGFMFKGDHASYVISKNAATDIIEYYNQQHGMSNAVFRLPPVYGVGPHGSLYINGTYVKSGLQIFIERAMVGEDILVYGDKTVSRDIVYVKDVANAFVMAIESEYTYGIYNISSGKGVTLDEQARVIASVFAPNNKASKIVYCPDIPNNSHSFILDITKANRDFNYAPYFSDFEMIMKDYKYEMERAEFSELFK